MLAPLVSHNTAIIGTAIINKSHYLDLQLAILTVMTEEECLQPNHKKNSKKLS